MEEIAIVYSIHVTNLHDKEGGLWHDTEIKVASQDYADAYNRIKDCVARVYLDGTDLEYTVFVTDWDGSRPKDRQASVLHRKEFRKRPLPATLEDFNAMESNEG